MFLLFSTSYMYSVPGWITAVKNTMFNGLACRAGYSLQKSDVAKILTYDDQRDQENVCALFKQERAFLDPSFCCCIEKTLLHRSADIEGCDKPGALTVKVLYDRQNFAGFIGYCYQNGVQGAGGLILLLAIMPQFRKKGYAAQLLNHAIQDCRARGCSAISIRHTAYNLEAARLYERLGFEAVRCNISDRVCRKKLLS